MFVDFLLFSKLMYFVFVICKHLFVLMTFPYLCSYNLVPILIFNIHWNILPLYSTCFFIIFTHCLMIFLQIEITFLLSPCRYFLSVCVDWNIGITNWNVFPDPCIIDSGSIRAASLFITNMDTLSYWYLHYVYEVNCDLISSLTGHSSFNCRTSLNSSLFSVNISLYFFKFFRR